MLSRPGFCLLPGEDSLGPWPMALFFHGHFNFSPVITACYFSLYRLFPPFSFHFFLLFLVMAYSGHGRGCDAWFACGG